MTISEQTLDIIYLTHFVRGKSIVHISQVSGVSKSFLYKVRKEIINSNKYYI